MTTNTLIGSLTAERFAASLAEAAAFSESAPERHLEAIAASRAAVAEAVAAASLGPHLIDPLPAAVEAQIAEVLAPSFGKTSRFGAACDHIAAEAHAGRFPKVVAL